MYQSSVDSYIYSCTRHCAVTMFSLRNEDFPTLLSSVQALSKVVIRSKPVFHSMVCPSRPVYSSFVCPSKTFRPSNVCLNKLVHPSKVYSIRPVCPSNVCTSNLFIQVMFMLVNLLT